MHVLFVVTFLVRVFVRAFVFLLVCLFVCLLSACPSALPIDRICFATRVLVGFAWSGLFCYYIAAGILCPALFGLVLIGPGSPCVVLLVLTTPLFLFTRSSLLARRLALVWCDAFFG